MLPTLVRQTTGASALGGVLRVASPARPGRRSRARRSQRFPTRSRPARAPRAGTRRRRRRPRLEVPRRRSRRRCRRAARRAASGCDARTARSGDRVRGCAAHRPASTCRTTTATGTPSTIRSRAPMRCTSAWSAGRHPSCCAVAYTLRCGCTSTGSSTSPRPGCRSATNGDLDALAQCFEMQGGVDDAGNEAYGFLVAGGPRAELIAHARPRAARRGRRASTGSRRSRPAPVRRTQWPEGSDGVGLILTGVARFLAAHTPTRRELPTVVRIATRLRRGEAALRGRQRRRHRRRSRDARLSPWRGRCARAKVQPPPMSTA